MIREYNGWQIMTCGGFCTMKRYEATKGDKYHWAFRLKDCKAFCDRVDAGEQLDNLHTQPLYV